MKPYGVPRIEAGEKSSAPKTSARRLDTRAHTKSAKARSTRRYFSRVARAANRAAAKDNS